MLKNLRSKAENVGFISRHPVLANIIVIAIIALLGIWIVYLSLQIFTKHGDHDIVPKVENMSYTEAVKLLHDKGFRIDIRDSLYKEDVKPGYVIEQFPKSGSTVKPGRKIFLYINAVHPKEVIIDTDNHPAEDALRGYSFRQGMSRLEELGFKNVRVVKVLGDTDRIVKVLANGKTVKKTQKIPVNASLVVEVYDGRLGALTDSLQYDEYYQYSSQPDESAEDNAEDYQETGEDYTGEEDDQPVYVQ